MEDFINWIEENTIIEINPAQYFEDKYRWMYYDAKKNDWICSENIFDTKLSTLKDLLEKIKRIKVVSQ